MSGHHLILGELTDFITGQTLPDTHDEQYRQKLAHWLVERLGYPKSAITRHHVLTVRADDKQARVPVTYVIRLAGREAMIIQYGPGSLVTRHRPALAMGRLGAQYQVPVVVVTNGEEADILDGLSGRITGTGLNGIPPKARLMEILKLAPWQPISEQRAEKEARIVMAFEVDDRCPCDSTVCLTGNTQGEAAAKEEK